MEVANLTENIINLQIKSLDDSGKLYFIFTNLQKGGQLVITYIKPGFPPVKRNSRWFVSKRLDDLESNRNWFFRTPYNALSYASNNSLSYEEKIFLIKMIRKVDYLLKEQQRSSSNSFPRSRSNSNPFPQIQIKPRTRERSRSQSPTAVPLIGELESMVNQYRKYQLDKGNHSTFKTNGALKILNLNKNPTKKEIIKSWRANMLKYHPDKCNEDDSSEQEACIELGYLFNQARDYLIQNRLHNFGKRKNNIKN